MKLLPLRKSEPYTTPFEIHLQHVKEWREGKCSLPNKVEPKLSYPLIDGNGGYGYVSLSREQVTKIEEKLGCPIPLGAYFKVINEPSTE
jgi:hypothetical protein